MSKEIIGFLQEIEAAEIEVTLVTAK